MLDLSNATIGNAYATLIGNKALYQGVSEPIKLSINESVEFFFYTMLKKFDSSDHFMQFSLENKNMAYEQIYYAFNGEDLKMVAESLSHRLYLASEDFGKFKQGEFFVIELNQVFISGTSTSAIALIKVQNKETFLGIEKNNAESSAIVNTSQAITQKLELGAIILNDDEANGFTVFSIDTVTKKNDRSFWNDTFLRIQDTPGTDYLNTKHLIINISEFINSELAFKFSFDKKRVIEALYKASVFFSENEMVFQNAATNFIFDKEEGFEEITAAFLDRINTYEQSYSIIVQEEFAISPTAVKKYGNVFGRTISLDKNFALTVKGGHQHLERGFDEEKGRKYYKVYFDNEN